MNTQTPQDNGYPPQGNGWVPPTPPRPNPEPAGKKFFDALRGSGFYRSESRWLGGVAGGLARRLNVDPLIVRVAFVVLGCVLFGAALVAYAAAWALLPEERDGRIHAEELIRGNFDSALIAIFLAIAVGTGTLGSSVFFLDRMFDYGPLAALFWLGLIAAGGYAGYVIYNQVRESESRKADNPQSQDFTAPPAQPYATPPFQTGPAPQGTQGSQASPDAFAASVDSETTGGSFPPANNTDTSAQSGDNPGTQNAGAAYPYPGAPATPHGSAAGGPAPATGAGGPQAAWNQAGWNQAAWSQSSGNQSGWNQNAGWSIPEMKPINPPSGGFLMALGFAMIATAVFLAGQSAGWFVTGNSTVVILIAIVLVSGGLAVVINGLRGRSSGSGGFFGFLGIIAAVIVGIPTLVGANFTGPNFQAIADTTLSPASVSELRNAVHSFAVGDYTLDLTGIPYSELKELEESGDPLQLEISGGVGDLTIIAPNKMPLEVTGWVSVGEYTDPEQRRGGVGSMKSSYSHSGDTALFNEAPIAIDARLVVGTLLIEFSPGGLYDLESEPPANSDSALLGTEN